MNAVLMDSSVDQSTSGWYEPAFSTSLLAMYSAELGRLKHYILNTHATGLSCQNQSIAWEKFSLNDMIARDWILWGSWHWHWCENITDDHNHHQHDHQHNLHHQHHAPLPRPSTPFTTTTTIITNTTTTIIPPSLPPCTTTIITTAIVTMSCFTSIDVPLLIPYYHGIFQTSRFKPMLLHAYRHVIATPKIRHPGKAELIINSVTHPFPLLIPLRFSWHFRGPYVRYRPPE